MKRIARCIIMIIIASIILMCAGYMFLPRILVIGKDSKHKVYVALGFHANFYHSFRIDTNDEAGFGKDIRIVRKIIEVLDEKNKRGIPVKGVWDIENLFTLEEVLPKYAPDIIKNIQRRVKNNGDEIILMSYNNGLVSAMIKNEFVSSIKNAIANPQKSGVKDIFSAYSPYVRPQEMMVSAGNFNLYKELGVEGVVLYYSSIPFDAFRVFVDPLTLEEAHNPLMYNNTRTKESMLVIPAYNHADLIENVSIEHWVKMLRHEQLRGNIKRDVLLFINTDADDSYWYGYKLPSYLKWMPNTGGLSQLIDDIAQLDYVEFTTLKDYLTHHKPVKEISFGQDTADGSFNGYVSWAEKKYCSDYWTAVENDRRIHRFTQSFYTFFKKPVPPDTRSALKRSFETRMRLLSTTNFGMATPFLAKNREHVVENIIRRLQSITSPVITHMKNLARKYLQNEKQKHQFSKYEYVNSVLLLKQNDAHFVFTVPMEMPQGYAYYLKTVDSLIPVHVMSHEGVSRIFVMQQKFADGVYHIVRTEPKKKQYATAADDTILRNGTIQIQFRNGFVLSVEAHGTPFLMEKSFAPWIFYGGRDYRPEAIHATVVSDGGNGVAAIKLSGEINLPKNVSKGHFDYYLYLVDGIDIIFVDGSITYPDTPRTTIFKPGIPALARLYDPKWQQVAPCPLYPAMRATEQKPFYVIRRNYLGVTSEYLIDYFKHSSENRNLANINNHIAAEYVAVSNGTQCVAVARDNAVLSNFAFCPLQMTHDFFRGFSISMNPFGTFFGKQYYQPTWGNGQGFKAALLNGDQYHSGACTYSGTTQRFALAIAHGGGTLSQSTKDQLIAYANQPFVVPLREKVLPPEKVIIQPPKGVLALYRDGGVYVNFEKEENAASYTIVCSDKKANISSAYTTKETSLFIKECAKGNAFAPNARYSVSVQSADAQGKLSAPSPVYELTAKEIKGDMALPITLQLQIIFHTIVSKLKW